MTRLTKPGPSARAGSSISPRSSRSTMPAATSRGGRPRRRARPSGVWRGVLVGCGYIAPSHLQAWSRLPVSIEAVCDTDLDRARALAAEHGVPAVFATLTEALAAVAPDLVDVAAGPEAHPDLVEEAVGAGCHVLCQKPLANDLAGAERIVAAAGRGPVVAVNEMWKHLPGYAI